MRSTPGSSALAQSPNASASVGSAGNRRSMIFTFDATMPPNKDAVPQWVQALTNLLVDHTDDDSLRNRIHHLP
jgi:hypothetical protein